MLTQKCKAGLMVALLITATPSGDAGGFRTSDVVLSAVGLGTVMSGLVYFTQDRSPFTAITAGLLTAVVVGYMGYKQTPGYIKGVVNTHYLACKRRYERALAAHTPMGELRKNPTEQTITETIKNSEGLDSFEQQFDSSQAEQLKHNAALYREYATGVESVDEAFIERLLSFARELEDMHVVLDKLLVLRSVRSTLADIDHMYARVFELAELKRDIRDSPLTEVEVYALAGDVSYPYLAVDLLLKKLHSLLFETGQTILLAKQRAEGFSLTNFQEAFDKKVRLYEVILKEMQADVVRIQSVFLATYRDCVREDSQAKREDEQAELDRKVAEARIRTEILTAEAEAQKAQAEREKAEAAREREQTRRAETLIDGVETLADIFGNKENRTQKHKVKVRTNG
jgi:hypothetical protein